ncbi:MAG: hypothetical protein K2O28_01695 [Clostridia bacterium]|nr:hypothetical protein [Clostridia bacterium]
MQIGILIAVAVVGIILIAILLKILSKNLIVYLVFLILAAAGIIISSFAMPHIEKDLPWGWIIAQALCIFLFCVSFCAGFAFDSEEVAVTDGSGEWNGNRFEYKSETKLESRSLFWSVLGGSLGVAAVLVFLNYVIFESHAIALGVIGCLAAGWAIIMLIKYIVIIHRSRHHRDYY